MKQTRLIAKVLWKVSGDGKEKKPAPMNTMQKGATHTSKTNLTSLMKRYVTLKIITYIKESIVLTTKLVSRMPQKMTNQEKSSDAFQLERGPLEKAANKKES